MNLPLTAMIDVVFQLLVYLIVTAKPKDVIANLDVFRPSPDHRAAPDTTPPKMIRVTIYPDGLTINDKQVSFDDLNGLMGKLAALDKNQTILITCTSKSRHENLIRVLDLCTQNGLKNLSVVSSD